MLSFQVPASKRKMLAFIFGKINQFLTKKNKKKRFKNCKTENPDTYVNPCFLPPLIASQFLVVHITSFNTCHFVVSFFRYSAMTFLYLEKKV